MKPLASDVEAVIRDCCERYDEGMREYGQLDIATDERDWIAEAIQELTDNINYSVFQIMKLKRLRRG